MDCAFDDDRTIVFAMMDFAISAIFSLIYSKKLLTSTAIFSNSFNHRAFKLWHKLLYGHLIMDCAFDDDRTIVVAMVDFAISANKVFYIVNSLFSPFRMTIYHMLSVRQVVWRVIHTRPNLPQAEWLVMRRLLGWMIDSNDGYVHISNWGMPNSSVGCVSASWSKDRGFDPGFS